MPHVALSLLLLAAAPAQPDGPRLAYADVPVAGEISPRPDPDVQTTAPPAPPSTPALPDAPALPEAVAPPATATEPGAPASESSTPIVVSARAEAPREDPLQQANVESYKVVQAVDQALVRPVAMGYKNAVPKPIRHGIRNFINNLDEPITALNYLLQLKPGKAAETVGRFAINTTLGLGGLIDVAKDKPFNLPRRFNGLANTLGYYGVGPGPYLFLPLIGPTTARDLVGRTVDFAIVPTVVGPPLTKPEFAIPKGVLGAIGDRIADDNRIRRLRDNSDDGYAEIRKAYLERRQAEIDALKGRPVAPPEPPPAPPLSPAEARP